MVTSSKNHMTADAVVIGGGLMGTSILYNLVERGMKNSVLFERWTLGSGSTGRSSGIIHLFTDPEEPRARLTLESLRIYRNFAEIVGGSDAGFVNTGFLITVSKNESKAAKKHVLRQQNMGVPIRHVSLEEAQELAPSFSFLEDEVFFWEPKAGYGDPYEVTSAYATRAREKGARVVLDDPVLEIDLEGGRVVAVKTAHGRLETPNVIVATGPWSRTFLSKIGIDLPLQPTLAEVFVLRRPTDQIPNHTGGSDPANGIYFRPEGKDFTLVGGSATPGKIDPDSYTQHPTEETVGRHWSALNRRVPLMSHAEFFRGYTGMYTVTPDQMPVIDLLDGIDGLFVCTGFSGRGFKLAPAVGAVVADLVFDGGTRLTDISSMRIDRF
ncbi:FAD-binding oxidoreductase [Dehalococcoidia bacterium]|nr:FAD-binding oxidoreductase [Dehalococcoidia bacterium]